MANAKKSGSKQVETIRHGEAKRKNIPTAEHRSAMEKDDQNPIPVPYARRNRDLDPQLVWRGKDEQDWSDLVVPAPPLFIQEKVHPKVLIDDLVRESARRAEQNPGPQIDLFSDFNGVPEGAKTDFYQHDANWTNRMILGDSLQVMASLAEREGLRGQIQCIYLDPPYGIKFNSNFQWSTTSRDVKDGNVEHITREPEQVKAFRDTWRDGIHSYLTYLRDRLTVARELLTESGSIFVQIGDENVHRVRALMDEVFGDENFCAAIAFRKTGGFDAALIQRNFDHILWYANSQTKIKFRSAFKELKPTRSDTVFYDYVADEAGDFRPLSTSEKLDPGSISSTYRLFARNPLVSDGFSAALSRRTFFKGLPFDPPANGHWKTTPAGLVRLEKANRLAIKGKTLRYVAYWEDFAAEPYGPVWADLSTGGFTGDPKTYVVQTDSRVIQRCILMTSDPGDLVLDPTCGSGTTAYVAEQWARRWITIDTSRVALALARARLMGARYPYYYLADSRDGQVEDAKLRKAVPSDTPTRGDVRQGFVYDRVPHIQLSSIANNSEIDVIWEKYQKTLDLLLAELNIALGRSWEEWEVPREAAESWLTTAKDLHNRFWQTRISRQKETDASIARNADPEILYDKPYDDKRKVRVAGPFTVESLSPHRVLGVDADDELIDPLAGTAGPDGEAHDFASMILENLKISGVQQAHKEDRITFSSVVPWPGDLICGEGRFLDEGTGKEKRAAILVGPEFGTVTRPDLAAAAREAAEADFDLLVAFAFSYEAQATDYNRQGRITVLKARMNADLHMATDLKNTGKGNLFVIFGEPDIDVFASEEPSSEPDQIQVRINGVDTFHPQTGEVRSDGPEGIACWFLDTDYNEESFFVKHAYFLGATSDPYKALKTSLKAEIDLDAWATLNCATSRPFAKPKSGRIAVKVINHLGDEVMKVFRVA
jgi:adenine-specific DNA-methyltransferase